ncbi:MAG: hypothetical protein CV081_11035 [Nitrospira sp. LK265]|nr:hypothetical protein [Nitrospira sp. LK265]
MDSPLRRAWLPVSRSQAGRLAARSVDILFQVCLPSSRLRVPVSLGDSAISRRTVMNNVGSAERFPLKTVRKQRQRSEEFYRLIFAGQSTFLFELP